MPPESTVTLAISRSAPTAARARTGCYPGAMWQIGRMGFDTPQTLLARDLVGRDDELQWLRSRRRNIGGRRTAGAALIWGTGRRKVPPDGQQHRAKIRPARAMTAEPAVDLVWTIEVAEKFAASAP